MKRLRSYARPAPRSPKVIEGAAAFAAVYRQVDERADGRCEVWRAEARCERRGIEHHHLFKPRRAHHTVTDVVLICRDCHDRTEWPYQRGRLVYLGTSGSRFLFAVRFASDKFGARGETP